MSNLEIYQIDSHYVITKNVHNSESHIKSAVANLSREGAHEQLQGGRYSYLYRKCSEAEFNIALKHKGLEIRKKADGNAEMCLTKTLDHTKKLVNSGATTPTDVTMEIGLHKGVYRVFGEAIPQKGSIALQPMGWKMKNVVHDKLLKGHSKGKMDGPKNVKVFNQMIVSVIRVDPDNMTESAVWEWIRRYRITEAFFALGVVVNAGKLIISLIKDGGKFGRSVKVALSEIAGGTAGARIGGYIGSVLLPGIGTFVGSFLGGIIGSFIAGKITGMLVVCNPTGQDQAPQPLDTDLFTFAGMGLDTGIEEISDMGLDTGVIGIQGMGLYTGVIQVPLDF